METSQVLLPSLVDNFLECSMTEFSVFWGIIPEWNFSRVFACSNALLKGIAELRIRAETTCENNLKKFNSPGEKPLVRIFQASKQFTTAQWVVFKISTVEEQKGRGVAESHSRMPSGTIGDIGVPPWLRSLRLGVRHPNHGDYYYTIMTPPDPNLADRFQDDNLLMAGAVAGGDRGTGGTGGWLPLHLHRVKAWGGNYTPGRLCVEDARCSVAEEMTGAWRTLNRPNTAQEKDCSLCLRRQCWVSETQAEELQKRSARMITCFWFYEGLVRDDTCWHLLLRAGVLKGVVGSWVSVGMGNKMINSLTN